LPRLEVRVSVPVPAPRRRRGPAPLDEIERRGHCVSVRLSAAELAALDERRAAVRMQRGAYLRAAALLRLPPSVPEVNREAWASLARAAGNLNQIARHLAGGDAVVVSEIRAALAEFRRGLIGADLAAADEGEDR
jgi:hypothetical protein